MSDGYFNSQIQESYAMIPDIVHIRDLRRKTDSWV